MRLELTARKTESPDVESFIFKSKEPLDWKPGQFLHYVLHHEPTDDRGSDRWFSIASAPCENHVMLTTRFAKDRSSTFKDALKKLKAGDTVEVSDLDGDFVVGDPRHHYVFIAGGIGITPFRSILKDADHAGRRLRVNLIYANRDQNVVYKPELEAFAKRNPDLQVHYLFSPQKIDKETIQKLAPDLKKSFFYVSGPEPMVESVGKMLQELGVAKNNLKQDWFPGYPAD
jgi:ferredoxin-NADP reductase